ncbi:hypothetical protein BJF93_20595 [Xaviernesmea oryzae]|uniref:Uncharacterized protein n=1 Tax=Xaviernesmea oryzae TaxID=464029 RepID=A0A1Q9B3T7_9HYPH|nr:hypothetical protein [Xaviernesmea oryzae]OLP62695.1 hypothetical protein BJF93_20595 [Xaviernesmea oryzae]SEM37022.1 hypothetical protein SAMN04487976_1349 [Xaviernesmea oryzae]
MSQTIRISDPLPGTRRNEPITFTVQGDLPQPLWWARTDKGERVLCQRLTAEAQAGETRFVACLGFEGEVTLTLETPAEEGAPSLPGIRALDGREVDCFVRLDTGAFDLEMCSGTAGGLGSSKWGLRHFRALDDGFELLPSGNNAIGGFYGPFFTPENGLINPPEHTVVRIETVERGPVLHHYRMHGTIPDGLLDELKGKSFTIDWRFTYGTPYFQRRYRVDDFQTVINGRSVTNKITVGDEFEGGIGELVFDRFAAYGGTRYRAGDPYAGELVAMVADTVAHSKNQNPKFEEFRAQLSDIEAAHWDLYWRLFCAWEKVLGEDEIRARLARVRAASRIKADLPDQRPWVLTDEPVDVSAVPHETIFPGPASKTVEYHEASGRAMVWWTSAPSGAFQIVQRRQSGWVNWGSNGENECPELPVGVDIKTAYGQFKDRWQEIADQMETPPRVVVEMGV